MHSWEKMSTNQKYTNKVLLSFSFSIWW